MYYNYANGYRRTNETVSMVQCLISGRSHCIKDIFSSSLTDLNKCKNNDRYNNAIHIHALLF